MNDACLLLIFWDCTVHSQVCFLCLRTHAARERVRKPKPCPVLEVTDAESPHPIARAPDAEIAGFIRAVGAVARSAGLVEPGYRLLANIGQDGHQEVPHLHVHVFAGRPLGPMLAR